MNHNKIGQRSLEDVIAIVGHQLRALGHSPVYRPENNQLVTADCGINVMVEGFNAGVVEVMAEYRAKGARFLILATEEPTGRGFNHGRDPAMVDRQKHFPAAAALSDGILHLVPGEAVTRWYAQHAPAAYVELGYAPTLMRLQPMARPDHDFGFFGTISKRRQKMLRRLQKLGTLIVSGEFEAGPERDRIMRRAKVVVQIRKHEEMGLVSSSRCNTALCIGRPVVAEPHLHSKPWDEIVDFAGTVDGFFSMAIMARISWQALYDRQLAAFRQKLTPEACLGRALQEIGLTEVSE
jgi:hypothetical protein